MTHVSRPCVCVMYLRKGYALHHEYSYTLSLLFSLRPHSHGRYAATNAELGGGNAPASPLLSLQTAGVAKRERWREGPKSKKKSRRAAAHCEAGEQWMRRAAAGGGDGAASADPLVVSKLNIWWLQSNFVALQ